MAKIKYQGRDVEVVPVPIREVNEHWNEYTLEDGSTARIKIVLSKVFRAVDEKTELGEPLYIIQTSNIVTVDVNPDLMEEEGVNE